MRKNVTYKLLESHIVSGKISIGEEIGIKIDQTLTQDATGTMVMLELEAMGLKRTCVDISVQYVDHNQLQEDYKNPDDHLFLQTSACNFGIWFSKPGNGISHQVHAELFGKPGKTLLGSDSHTPANGSLCMLAIGTGGLEVAGAICGEPFFVKVPKVVGVKLIGKLRAWVSAKDVVLELLSRHNVFGGIGKVFEYYGSGLDNLSVMDRHVIANMGAELGATTSVFPSDKMTKKFLNQMGRVEDYVEIQSDKDAEYDEYEEIDLSTVVPMIALPSSPGNVKKVSEVVGRPIFQSYVGSSANPSYRDFAVSAMMVKDRLIHENVSFDINPSSRQVANFLIENGYMGFFTKAGARIHQSGCNGCIGMGQAPATKQISLRTVPRNFPGRSGTREDQVYLCSPETATASAITGVITDPRELDFEYPLFSEPSSFTLVSDVIAPKTEKCRVIKGPNIKEFPIFNKIEGKKTLKVVLKVGDNISTDAISPAGARSLPFRSNIPAISKFTYCDVDPSFYKRAMDNRKEGSVIVGGKNYGQGSSREHAAISTRYLSIFVVLVKSFARIHRKNLVNFGVLPLTFTNEQDFDTISMGDQLFIPTDLYEKLSVGRGCLEIRSKDRSYKVEYLFTATELDSILHGGLINIVKGKMK